MDNTEKFIAGLFISFGILALVMQTWGLITIWDTAARYYEGIEGDNLSLSSFVFRHHYKIVLPVLTIFSGIILLMRKKQRLTSGLMVSILNIAWLVFGLIRINRKSDPPEVIAFILIGGMLLIFVTVFVILLTRTYRDRLTTTTWGTIFIITTILLVDSFRAYNF